MHVGPVPKAILFDYGGTVATNTTWDDLAGNREVLRHCSANPDKVDEFDVQRRAKELDRLFGPLLDATGLEVPVVSFQRTLYEGLGVRCDLSPADMEFTFYRTASDYRLTPGIVDLLRFLAGKGIKMAIVSNFAFSARCIEYDLDRLGLRGVFAFVMTSSQYGLRKPDRHLFDIARRNAGCDEDAAWFVGDSFDADVVGASRAGLFPVWYNPGRQKGDPRVDRLEIQEMAQLAGILDGGPAPPTAAGMD